MKYVMTLTAILFIFNAKAQDRTTGKQKLSNGSYKEAVEIFDKILAKQPTDKEVLFYKGIATEQLGRYNDARLAYTHIIQQDAQNAPAFERRAVTNVKLHDYQAAVADFSSAIELNPANKAQIHAQRAEAYFHLQRYERAAADFDLAKEAFPNNAYILYQHAVCLNRLGQFNNAVSMLTDAIAIAPDYIDAIFQRGVAYSNLSQWDEAIADFESVLTKSPAYAEAYAQIGVIYAKKEEFSTACDYFQKANTDYKGVADEYIKLYKCNGAQ